MLRGWVYAAEMVEQAAMMRVWGWRLAWGAAMSLQYLAMRLLFDYLWHMT